MITSSLLGRILVSGCLTPNLESFLFHHLAWKKYIFVQSGESGVSFFCGRDGAMERGPGLAWALGLEGESSDGRVHRVSLWARPKGTGGSLWAGVSKDRFSPSHEIRPWPQGGPGEPPTLTQRPASVCMNGNRMNSNCVNNKLLSLRHSLPSNNQ